MDARNMTPHEARILARMHELVSLLNPHMTAAEKESAVAAMWALYTAKHESPCQPTNDDDTAAEAVIW
jgi:hypothetical protein